MFTIALTGGIACGKSTVSGMLAQLGAAVIDADAISRSLTADGGAALPAVRSAFGDGVFHADGSLDRAALSAVVFADKQALAALNGIIHPMVIRQMEDHLDECRKTGAGVVVLDVPLLFEAGMQGMGDIVACVTVPQEVQIARLHSRNGYTREEALSRIRNQMPVEDKARLSDVVIDTDCTLDELAQKVETLYQGWVDAARKEHA
ncbi:MAG: dephospho-CoA kinase [Clostridia bacterium]|nr:dephospho-CoA kinase [Clostridia bacterium]